MNFYQVTDKKGKQFIVNKAYVIGFEPAKPIGTGSGTYGVIYLDGKVGGSEFIGIKSADVPAFSAWLLGR